MEKDKYTGKYVRFKKKRTKQWKYFFCYSVEGDVLRFLEIDEFGQHSNSFRLLKTKEIGTKVDLVVVAPPDEECFDDDIFGSAEDWEKKTFEDS